MCEAHECSSALQLAKTGMPLSLQCRGGRSSPAQCCDPSPPEDRAAPDATGASLCSDPCEAHQRIKRGFAVRT